MPDCSVMSEPAGKEIYEKEKMLAGGGVGVVSFFPMISTVLHFIN